jgi:hypothetical protein
MSDMRDLLMEYYDQIENLKLKVAEKDIEISRLQTELDKYTKHGGC